MISPYGIIEVKRNELRIPIESMIEIRSCVRMYLIERFIEHYATCY